MVYKGILGFTRVYKGILGYTRVYKGISGYARGYTGVYKGSIRYYYRISGRLYVY